MMTALRISPTYRRPVEMLPGLRLSLYDRVASWLLAWLLLAGAVAFCLFFVWLGMRGILTSYKSVPVYPMDLDGAGSQEELGADLSLASPGMDEVAAETDLSEPEFQSTLQTVISAAATRDVQTGDEVSFDEPRRRKGKGGKASLAGIGGVSGKPGIPTHLRWEIDWGSADTLETYARKLDYFGIELGAFGIPRAGQVTYIKNLSRPSPDVRVGTSKTDERLYMSWRSGALKEADRRLAAKAGVSPVPILLQFFPPETEELLLRIEHDFRNRDATTIRKTRFGLRPVGRSYEFYIIEQSYL